jgi:hypothetical protein
MTRVGDVLVISGPPGAGKSAVAAMAADSFDLSILVKGDAFFSFLRRGAVEPWLPESAAQNDVVTAAAGAATGRFADGPHTVVYDGVVGPWYLSTFLQHAGVAFLSYAVLLPPVEQCVEQVRHRVGHGFTDEPATRAMHQQFREADIDPGHVFANPTGRLEETVEAILAAHGQGALQVTA